MIAQGFGVAGRGDLAAKVLSAMFKVAQSEPDLRLPELFSGLASDYAEKPVWYPVSCSPQAWAAGSVFMMLQGALGLRIDADKHELHVCHPALPAGISRLELKNLHVGERSVDLRFSRVNGEVKCNSGASDGGVTVVVDP